ncbi:MAG: tRNA uridine-5-carboxymethylaminomethyl(34) synthesis GTPase MnmE [Bacteroidota bacterium]
MHPSIDIIAAISTAAGSGAIAVIRVSGNGSIELVNKIFEGKNLTEQQSHTLHFGNIVSDEKKIDEVVIGLFRNPKSYTGEDIVEISCHGSNFIQQQILQLLLHHGARNAKPGEFTFRAFINGKMDLASAEAVADLIAADSESSHQMAIQQMRGGFSNHIKKLRGELIKFASLIELELDFSEEDVEFANRKQLNDLLTELQKAIFDLAESFRLGNVLKIGVNTVIAGRPNAGKSTLLNILLNEERAIVSDIPGTTRDTIEETLNIHGVIFRLADTAGLRDTSDVIEKMGVDRTHEKLQLAAVVIYLFDAARMDEEEVLSDIDSLNLKDIPVILAANKSDLMNIELEKKKFPQLNNLIFISAKESKNIIELKDKLFASVFDTKIHSGNAVVSNVRHYDALMKTLSAIDDVVKGLNNQSSGEMYALDIRRALDYLGEITGEITNEDLLDSIFRNFCIGK